MCLHIGAWDATIVEKDAQTDPLCEDAIFDSLSRLSLLSVICYPLSMDQQVVCSFVMNVTSSGAVRGYWKTIGPACLPTRTAMDGHGFGHLAHHVHRNVLLLLADDLTLSPPSDALTPTLHQLASSSIVLPNHYTAVPSCSPARTALLTSRRPDATGVYDLYTYWRENINATSLPQWFKARGYSTIGLGKCFHPNHASGRRNASEPGGAQNDDQDAPYAWTEPYWHVPDASLAIECGAWRGTTLACAPHNRTSWRSVASGSDEAASLPDVAIADQAILVLRQLDNRRRAPPFFLAVGFHRPHLPLIVPTTSFEVARDAASNAGLGPLTPSELTPPMNVPPVAWHGSGELTAFSDVAQAAGVRAGRPLSLTARMPTGVANALRLAYAASLHHLDEQIGRVVHALRRRRYANRTIVVATADHGFGMGTDGVWGKHHLFEAATRIPLYIQMPHPVEAVHAGGGSSSYSESIDVFPTLALLATGERVPSCSAGVDGGVCTAGQALVEEEVHTPTAAGGRRRVTVRAKPAAFVQHPAVPAGRAKRSPCLVSGHCVMGYGVASSIEGHAYRFAEWAPLRRRHAGAWEVEWALASGVELYNLSDGGERRNVAGARGYEEVEARLRRLLRVEHVGGREIV